MRETRLESEILQDVPPWGRGARPRSGRRFPAADQSVSGFRIQDDDTPHETKVLGAVLAERGRLEEAAALPVCESVFPTFELTVR